MKIRKGDNVLVISWKDKWKTWKVLKVLTKTNRVVVENANMVTRHFKKMWTQAGQILKKENPIDASNVMLVCPFTSKPTRVWFVFIEEKWITKKFRFSKIALKQKWWDAKNFIIK
jgi:large subunit ribosomal protein L24